jgi:hypothetical protein
MDPITFWTASLVFVTVVGGLFKYFANGLEKRMDELHSSVTAKLDKQEHQQTLQRIDRDMDQLRTDQNSRLDRFEAKIDKLIDWAMERK